MYHNSGLYQNSSNNNNNNNNSNMNYLNDNGFGLGRVDSQNIWQMAASSSLRVATDIFCLNKTFSMGRSNSRFELNRQATNMSQMSVGGFKMAKDIGINQNGHVIYQTYFDPTQNNQLANLNGNHNHNINNSNMDFMTDIDNMMFNNSANNGALQTSQPVDASTLMKIGNSINNQNHNHNSTIHKSSDGDTTNKQLGLLHDMPFQMTNSEAVMDPVQKSAYSRAAALGGQAMSVTGIGSQQPMNKSNIDGLHLLGESASNKQASLISINLTQFQQESNMFKFSSRDSQFNSNHQNHHHHHQQPMQASQFGLSGAAMMTGGDLSAAMSMNPLLMQASNFMFPMSLVDKKIETRSEPDIDVSPQIGPFTPDIHLTHNLDSNRMQLQPQSNTHYSDNKGSSSAYQNHHNNSSNDLYTFQNDHSSQQQQLSHQQQQQYQLSEYSHDLGNQKEYYAQSDDEGRVQKESRKKKQKKGGVSQQNQEINAAVDAATSAENGQQKAVKNVKQAKGPQYRQSRHKNVFKNFGGTLVRFIVYNEYFQARVITELQRDAAKQKDFQNWLQNSVKLERKKDFQIAWTTFKSDSESIREFKALLRELSKDFFENFSFIYLINSKKISDMEIHLRSIHTYLAAINQPDSLERFKPV